MKISLSFYIPCLFRSLAIKALSTIFFSALNKLYLFTSLVNPVLLSIYSSSLGVGYALFSPFYPGCFQTIVRAFSKPSFYIISVYLSCLTLNLM